MPVTTTRARTLTVHCRTLNPFFVCLRDHQTPEFGLRSWTSSGGEDHAPDVEDGLDISRLVTCRNEVPGLEGCTTSTVAPVPSYLGYLSPSENYVSSRKKQLVFPLVIFSPVRGEQRDDHSSLTDGDRSRSQPMREEVFA